MRLESKLDLILSVRPLTRYRIKNPLVGVSRDDLMLDVDNYARENNLEDIRDLLRKGALVAQSPELLESIPELDEGERESLRREITNKWRQPKILYFTIILNSIAAAIQGWDQTGSNGANLSWPLEFGIPDFLPECEQANQGYGCATNQWLVGVVNSMPYFAIFFLWVLHKDFDSGTDEPQCGLDLRSPQPSTRPPTCHFRGCHLLTAFPDWSGKLHPSFSSPC